MNGLGSTRGIGLRIALAATLTALVAVAILGLGVVVVGGEAFTRLMEQHGESTAAAHSMFDASVTIVVVLAVAAALVAAGVVAILLGERLARPLREIGRAAQRVAAGDYAARVPRRGPDEVAGLADSFNQMAAVLEEQERLRRELIANAAHELRTPLTNLRGYLEALRDGVIEPDRATYESLLEEAERLVRLSASLDTLADGDARRAPRRSAEADLATVVAAAGELARPALERASIRFEMDLADGLQVIVDPDALAQVLGNLLQNAVRYTPAGGHVAVRTERRGDEAFVGVTNSGEGIPAADLPHVFERFYRVEKSRDRSRGGAGIGLSIVQQTVEAAGGRVGAESGHGLTRFWFMLPAVPGPGVPP